MPKSYPVWSERFRDILIGFFDFYTDFEYTKNIISVFEGETIDMAIVNVDDDKLSDIRRR